MAARPRGQPVLRIALRAVRAEGQLFDSALMKSGGSRDASDDSHLAQVHIRSPNSPLRHRPVEITRDHSGSSSIVASQSASLGRIRCDTLWLQWGLSGMISSRQFSPIEDASRMALLGGVSASSLP